MTQACAGLTVVDATQGMAGGLATMVLADGGAEVIKIEPPRGDWARSQPAFSMWNRGKKSVVLDLKSQAGRDALSGVLGQADVFLSPWSPDEAQRLGLDYAELRAANPGLVLCALTGFGPLKRYAHLKGYEGIVAAKTGRHRAFDGQIKKDGPIYAAVPCASFGAAMYAVQGILAALHARRRSGRGQLVETSLVQALNAYDWGYLAWQMQRRGGSAGGGFVAGSPTPQYYVARTKDGRWVQMANAMSHLVVNYVVGIGAGDMLDDPRFSSIPNIEEPADMEAMYEIWQSKMSEKTLDEWMRIFTTEVDVGAEPFLTTQEGMEHHQTVHNGNIIDVDDPVLGRTRQLGPLVKLSETPMTPRGAAPALGQHTDEVLAGEVLAGLADRRVEATPNQAEQSRYPLEGVTVLEFASWFAAPFGPSILADMGARVIKVEPIEGDPWRAWGPLAVKTIQGKESLAIDLKAPDAGAIVAELLKRTDILMHNYRPGVPERLGIGYEQVKALNPRIIYHYAGAYGSSGPCSHRPAFHPIPGAICGGVRYQVGRETPPPPDATLSYPEMRAVSSTLFRANEGNPDVTSALAVATALLLALHARETTGLGQYVETSMLCSNLYVNSDDCISYAGKPERRYPDPELNGLHALYRFYRAKEGWVFLACPTQGEWEAFCREADRRELANDRRFADRDARLANDDALAAQLQETFAQRSAGEWEERLAPAGVGCVEVFDGTYSEFANTNPEMKATGLMVEVEHPTFQRYWRYGPGVTFSDCASVMGSNTYPGEHTASILAELGFDEAAIADLARRGIVAAPGQAERPA